MRTKMIKKCPWFICRNWGGFLPWKSRDETVEGSATRKLCATAWFFV